MIEAIKLSRDLRHRSHQQVEKLYSECQNLQSEKISILGSAMERQKGDPNFAKEEDASDYLKDTAFQSTEELNVENSQSPQVRQKPTKKLVHISSGMAGKFANAENSVDRRTLMNQRILMNQRSVVGA